MGTETIKLPADRLGKLPRRVTVGIYLDEALADVHQAAVAALDLASERVENERPRRIAAAKTAASPGDAGVDDVLGRVDADAEAELEPLRGAVDEALTVLDAGTVWYTFRALGRKAYRELVAKHPPTDADHEAMARDTGNAEAKAAFATETLAPELIQAACISPELTAEHVVEIFDCNAWSEVEIQALFVTALAAQTQARAVQHRSPPIPAVEAIT